MSWTLVTAIALGLLLFLGIAIYNRLVRRKTMVEEGWSGIDTQLKRRANLIPNLVETVKGYTDYEQETLEAVTRARAESLGAGSVADQGVAERHLGAALGRLFAVAEAYPDLKANASFLDLQNVLAEVEDQIQLARRYYNGTVRDLNILIDSFPSNLIAGAFNFHKAEFFELEDAAEAEVPEVELGS